MSSDDAYGQIPKAVQDAQRILAMSDKFQYYFYAHGFASPHPLCPQAWGVLVEKYSKDVCDAALWRITLQQREEETERRLKEGGKHEQ